MQLSARQCGHCMFTLVSQRFTTRQLSTIPAFLWKSFSFFLQFSASNKNQCWSLKRVWLVNTSTSTEMLLQPKTRWRCGESWATTAPPRPLRMRGPRTSAPPAGEAARGRPLGPQSLQEGKKTSGFSRNRVLEKPRGRFSLSSGGFSQAGQSNYLPEVLSMAWWRFMGSTDEVMLSPSASSRLLWVSASPVGANGVSGIQQEVFKWENSPDWKSPANDLLTVVQNETEWKTFFTFSENPKSYFLLGVYHEMSWK